VLYLACLGSALERLNSEARRFTLVVSRLVNFAFDVMMLWFILPWILFYSWHAS